MKRTNKLKEWKVSKDCRNGSRIHGELREWTKDQWETFYNNVDYVSTDRQ